MYAKDGNKKNLRNGWAEMQSKVDCIVGSTMDKKIEAVILNQAKNDE